MQEPDGPRLVPLSVKMEESTPGVSVLLLVKTEPGSTPSLGAGCDDGTQTNQLADCSKTEEMHGEVKQEPPWTEVKQEPPWTEVKQEEECVEVKQEPPWSDGELQDQGKATLVVAAVVCKIGTDLIQYWYWVPVLLSLTHGILDWRYDP